MRECDCPDGVRGGRRGRDDSPEWREPFSSRGSRDRELEADEEKLEGVCVLREVGRLGPASALLEYDSGIEGNSEGDVGRDPSNGGRIGVVMLILRECGCVEGICEVP